MSYSTNGVQEAVIHHAANVAAVSIPIGAVVFHLPETIAVITGCLGIIWYTILIAEKFFAWKEAREHRAEEIDTANDGRDPIPDIHKKD